VILVEAGFSRLLGVRSVILVEARFWMWAV